MPEVEIISAHFGLLPGFAKDIKYGVRTYNARSETVATLPSFKNAWAKARHCIVPAEAIYEPDCRSGKHVPTRFTMADGEPMGIAGLWQPWRAPTGEWINSFTMITINADDHPLMKHMHRPEAPARDAGQAHGGDLAGGAVFGVARCTGRAVDGVSAPYPAELMVMTAEPVGKAVPDLDVGFDLLNQ